MVDGVDKGRALRQKGARGSRGKGPSRTGRDVGSDFFQSRIGSVKISSELNRMWDALDSARIRSHFYLFAVLYQNSFIRNLIFFLFDFRNALKATCFDSIR